MVGLTTPKVRLQVRSRHSRADFLPGVWLSSATQHPFATVIGSSNYGPRSAARDMEVNLLVTTRNPELQEQLHLEVARIHKYAIPVGQDTFEKLERKVGPGVKLAAWIIKDML